MVFLYDYGVLMKPKVLFAMLSLYVISYFTSFTFSSETFNTSIFCKGFLAVSLAVSGANAINCYLDRDIDALMTRTQGRPLSLGTIKPSEALSISVLMISAAGLTSISLGQIPFFFLLEGICSYVLLYTILIKRKSSFNVIATAPSVATPAWFGWYLGGDSLFPLGFLMGLIVSIWGPLHLWSIAFVYSKDYVKVGVPMFPSIVSREKAIKGILCALIVLIFSSYLPFLWIKSQAYLFVISILNLVLIYAGLKLFFEKSNKAGWWIFKVTSPYIIFVFLIFFLNQTL